jgi:hypothetical protein
LTTSLLACPPLNSSPPTERVALSRDLANFLIELAIALQNHAVYPPDHPFLARSAEAVLLRAHELLRGRSSISFGVARDRLVIEGVATAAENPVLSGLAARLHRHRVGAVAISSGVTMAELAAVLTALAVEAELAGPLMASPARAEWPHVRLHALSFGDLEMADGAAGTAERSARAPELWIGLARAALQGGEEADDPAVVAMAIDRHAHAAAYDQVIVGYLLQLAEELRSGGGRGTGEVRRRLSQLIAELRPETLRRLVEMGGDADQRGRFLLDASHGLAAEAVVRLVEAAAVTSRHPVSDSLLRLLRKLAVHADRSHTPDRGAAGTALREQVERLVSGWSLADPNPETYRTALDRIARAPAGTPAALPAGEPEPARIVQTALEIDVDSPAAWAAIAAMVGGGALGELVELLARAPAGCALAERVWEEVATPDAAVELLRAGPAASGALDRVCARLGADAAVGVLMDEMVRSESRGVRRAALARLATLGTAAAAEATRRLDDGRWYVLRNLLALLGELDASPEPATLRALVRHGDERVRREAFKLAFRHADERAYALSLALSDSDPQVLRLALAECAAGCPPTLLPQLCRRAGDPAVDPELRVAAVRVLGASREPLALRTLLHLTDGGRSFLGRRKVAAATPEVLAALTTLAASHWADDATAAATLALAAAAADPALRAAAAPPRGRT